MSAIRVPRQWLSTYIESEPWNEAPGGTMTCLDVEATMSMGVKLFRWLTDGEARCQQLALRGEVPPDDPVWEDIEQAYRSWLLASEKLLIRADEFARDGFDLDGLGEFRTTVDEARSLVARGSSHHRSCRSRSIPADQAAEPAADSLPYLGDSAGSAR